MRFILNIQIAISTVVAWCVAVGLVNIAAAVTLSMKLNVGVMVWLLAMLGLCRWVWNGSSFARYVAIGVSLITVALLVIVLVMEQSTDLVVTPLIVASVLVWTWFGSVLIFSSEAKVQLANHWQQVKSKDCVPVYSPIFIRGLVAGLLVSCIFVGGAWVKRQYSAETAKQAWIDSFVAEVSKQLPYRLEWLTLVKVQSGQNSLTYDYEIVSLEEGVTIEDAKRSIMEGTTIEKCESDDSKRLLSFGTKVVFRYSYAPQNAQFELSLNEMCDALKKQ